MQVIAFKLYENVVNKRALYSHIQRMEDAKKRLLRGNIIMSAANSSDKLALTREERLRRVVLVCVHFARNLAYYRGAKATPDGWRQDWAQRTGAPLAAEASFWISAYNNSLDICVLEFCKLFCERNGKHCWENIVSEPGSFRTKLLRELEFSEVEYLEYTRAMRHYRNKFVAHLDSDRTMNPPNLDKALAAVRHYHEHVATNEAKSGSLAGLIDNASDFDRGYRQEIEIASRVYRLVLRVG